MCAARRAVTPPRTTFACSLCISLSASSADSALDSWRGGAAGREAAEQRRTSRVARRPTGARHPHAHGGVEHEDEHNHAGLHELGEGVGLGRLLRVRNAQRHRRREQQNLGRPPA